MVRRVASTGRLPIALILVTGVIWAVMTADVAGAARTRMSDAITRNAVLAPRFDPSEPTRLDEFSPSEYLRSIHFDSNRVAIRPADARIIDADARWLKANPPYEVVIEGYADERGEKTYNLALAKRRAQTVRNALVARGIARDRIVLVSYGEARPECHGKVPSDACWSKNRRADILIRRLRPQTP